MSQKNGFGGGFILGSILGGVVGGILGTLLTTREDNQGTNEDKPLLEKGTRVQLSTEESIEVARRSLEDKIAQLNLAIDDVRQQLGTVNNGSVEQEDL